MTTLPDKVEEYINSVTSNLELALVYITSHSDCETLKTSKPKDDGTYAYIWRMCRFHSGIDVTMPTTCIFDLSWQIEKETGHKYLFGILDPVQKEILNRLDKFVDKLLEHLHLSKYEGAIAWKGLLY